MNPFMGMGIIPPWMSPMFQQDERPHPVPDTIVPPRVNKAIELLSLLSSKRRKSAAVSENQIELIEPDALTQEETATQDAALQLLTRYFDGKLAPDQWEQLRFDAIKRKNELGSQAARMIHCIACHPMKTDPNCPLCSGSGKLLVQPCGGGFQEGELSVMDTSQENQAPDNDQG